MMSSVNLKHTMGTALYLQMMHEKNPGTLGHHANEVVQEECINFK